MQVLLSVELEPYVELRVPGPSQLWCNDLAHGREWPQPARLFSLALGAIVAPALATGLWGNWQLATGRSPSATTARRRLLCCPQQPTATFVFKKLSQNPTSCPSFARPTSNL